MEPKESIQRPYKGLITDFSPGDQPKDTYRYAMNAVRETELGDMNLLAMEKAIENCTTFPENSQIVGHIYMNDGSFAIMLTDGTYSYIGILDKYYHYTTHVQTKELGFSVDCPVSGTFRIRRGGQRIIYFVSKCHNPRFFNFDRQEDFRSLDYAQYLEDLPMGSVDYFAGEKWEGLSFNLLKKYEFVPEFEKVEVLNGGNIPSGAYSIAIQLVDANLSSTEWITTSNPVNIYVDPLDSPFNSIRGSRNSTSDIQNFPNASKSIRWTIGNLDPNYSYYRIAVLIANQGDGNVNKALVSEIQSNTFNTFTYSGNDQDFTETSVEDILKSQVDIQSAEHIEQLENRLILVNTKGNQINWCEFQQYASKIKSRTSISMVALTAESGSDLNENHPKNPVAPFANDGGYMWGEVYSFGIVYVFDDGFESPAYHIPGRPETLPAGETSDMLFYECEDSKYIPVESCTVNDYWGKDGYGNDLLETNIRHHRFPFRNNEIVTTGFDSEMLGYIPYQYTIKLGVAFTNIERPHPKVVGYRIVRNTRTEDDKLIVDNVFIGSLTQNIINPGDPEALNKSTYHSFGLAMPDMTGMTDVKNSRKGFYIFSPEHQFKARQITFDDIRISGYYYRHMKYTPGGGTSPDSLYAGVYVQDVRPGTTFNSEYHKGEDPDGFDLQVLYRANTLRPVFDESIVLPKPDRTMYISAAGYKLFGGDTFFNSSSDNKIIICGYENEELDADLFYAAHPIFSVNVPRVLYGSLIKNNRNAYSNFMVRDYYREHNNVTMFPPLVETAPTSMYGIFNGDCYTTPISFNSSIYAGVEFGEPEKKSRVWKIVLGSVLLLAAVAVNVIPGAGQAISVALGSAGLTALTVLAVSYGVSTLTSGIEFETLKDMIDNHYESGLVDALNDADNKESEYKVYSGIASDDRFKWFSDLLMNVYLDSSVNMYLRVGTTAPITDFMNAPTYISTFGGFGFGGGKKMLISKAEYETYLINKLTVVDKDRNAGRLYIGYPTSEFYDINPDFQRHNMEKVHHYLPLEYDCCSETRELFPTRVHYSEQSYQEELLDNYRVFLPNNYRDIEGEYGEITNVFKWNNSLYIHTGERLFILPQNLQEKVTQELVTFIGTGEFFSIPPRPVLDGEKAIGGSIHKYATVSTRGGVFFVNQKEGRVYVIGEGVQDISAGNANWFKENLKSFLQKSMEQNIGKEYVRQDNILDLRNTGIHATYDARYERFILTKIDYRPTMEFSLYTNESRPTDFVYEPATNRFGVLDANSVFVEIPLTNRQYFEDKSWTMSYSMKDRMWVSWHSYFPRVFMSSPYDLFSCNQTNLVARHNVDKKFCVFYDRPQRFIVETISNSNPVVRRIWNHIELIVTSRVFNTEYGEYVMDDTKFFDRCIIYNSKQCTGLLDIDIKRENDEPHLYMLQQVVNSNTSLIANKVEGTWYINNFRDAVIAYNQPFFTRLWQDTKYLFPIDKVVNENVIDQDRDWTERALFSDTYLIMRLIFSKFDKYNNVQLILNYSGENEQLSLR